MRALALLFALVGFMPAAFCARPVTVYELGQTIAAVSALPDAEAAKQLSDLELRERLSAATLDRLKTSLPGEKSRQVLMVLADASVFLDPPASDITAPAAPDVAGQRQILALTVNYVTHTLGQLPNFFAIRATKSFEDTPAVQRPGAISAHGAETATAYQPIHLVGDSNDAVTFRDGREVVEKGKSNSIARSLTTSGVFGPILGTVLIDAARSKLAWRRWEQGPTGLEAVFSYAVPKENSHYTITYDSIPVEPRTCSTARQAFSVVVAYHGEIAIDPASGAILRLILLADIKPGEFTANSGIEVEYGQVSIGGKEYFLPTRSVTSSLAHSLLVVGAEGDNACPFLSITLGLQRSLNDVVFKDYHVFRADATVLTDSEAATLESQPAPVPPRNDSKQTEEAKSSRSSAATSADSLPLGDSRVAQSGSTATNPSASESQPAAQPAQSIAESASPTPPVPEESVSPGTPSGPVFRATARQVLIDVVVNKRNDDPVSGLTKSDFTIAENGKAQTIDFFEEHSAGEPAPVATPAMPPLPPDAITNVPTAQRSTALYVFLLDSLNTGPQDQVFVRQQILAFLHKLEPGTQVAVFSLGSQLRFLQGFTSDPAVLLAAVGRKEAERDAMAQTRSDDADDAQHTANLTAMRSAAPQLAKYSRGGTAQAYSFATRASMTFEALNALARYLQGIPGRKNLIWFSSSFPVVLFSTPAEMNQRKNDPNLPGYVNQVKQTANLFTLAKIAVYPVGVAGVMNSNVGLADSPDAGSAGGTGHFGTAASPTSSLTNEALNSASTLTNMEQLAASTGGRAFSTNDIDAALHRIVHDSGVYYTIGYSPSDTTPDDAFRQIEVKVAEGRYKLDYRRGYDANASSAGSARSEDPIAPLLQLGLPNATGIFYGATVAPSADRGSIAVGQNAQVKGPLTRYAISFTIRAEDIAFDQASDGTRIAKLVVGVKAYGLDGSALNWLASRETSELSRDEFASIAKTGLSLTIDLDLPANTPAHIVTAVYDSVNGRAGTLEIPIRP